MSNNSAVKRVAKNSVFMYIRLIVLMCISFYTSRLLLYMMGVEDYGVFSVVGSVASSFVALKSFFSESIQRFLNVAKGKKEGNIDEQISIFNLSIIIHIILAVLFVVVVEVVGFWLINNKLSIPFNRIDTAYYVFQMSILAIVLGIISIPYDALIIANEDMGFYAVISILDGTLKLLFVFILPIIGGDYLKNYSIFLVLIPLLTLVIQLFFCEKYDECKYRLKYDKKTFHDIIVLSGWNFIGNISFSLVHEGINMLLNIFGGVRLNASRAIAYQIKNVTTQVSSSSMVAIRPYVMQQSAQKSVDYYFSDICEISRLSFFLGLAPIVPLFVYCPQLINVWLVEAPENVSLFTRLILVGLLIRSLHEPINIMHMSFGNIKRMILVEASIMLIFLLIIYLVLRMTGYIWMPFFILTLMEVVIITGLIINAKYELGFPSLYYLQKVVIPMFLLVGMITISSYIIRIMVDGSSLISLLLGITLILLMELILFYSVMNQREKDIIKKLFNK